MNYSNLRKLSLASLAALTFTNALAPLTPSAMYRGRVAQALELEQEGRRYFRVNHIDDVPEYVLANPEFFEFEIHEIAEEVPGSRQRTTDEERARRFAPNFKEIEPEIGAIYVVTGEREDSTSIDDIPYWVLADKERYGFSDDTVTVTREVEEEILTGERISTEHANDVPTWVRDNEAKYSLRREFVENRKIENSRMITNNRTIAENHAPNFEALDPIVTITEERVFSANRVSGVLESAIPAYVRADARFDLRESGEFQWGEIRHSAVHPGVQSNIRAEEITLPEVSLPTVPSLGDIVSHGGFSWQVVGAETNPIYQGNHDGSQDWVGPWTGGFASVRGTVLGWTGTVRNVLNPNLTLNNTTTAQQAQNGGWWRLPILENVHFRRDNNGNIVPPTGALATWNTNWTGPLAPAPGHTVNPAARAAIVEHGFLYMSFSITQAGQVQWHKFVPIFTYESTFDLQRFEYQNGTPLWNWLDSNIVQRRTETPQYAFWQTEPVYRYSWEDSKLVTRTEEDVYPRFSWYTRAIQEIEVPQFEYWKMRTRTEYSWVVSDLEVEGETPELPIITPEEDDYKDHDFEKEYGINNEVPTVEVPDYEYDDLDVVGQTPELPIITPEEDDYKGHDFEKEYGINNEVPIVEVPDYEYDDLEVEGQTPELPTITPEEDDYKDHDFEKEYGINNEVPTVEVPDYEYDDLEVEGQTPEFPSITPEEDDYEGHDFEPEYDINNEVPTVEVPDYEYDDLEVEGQTPELPSITPEEDDYKDHDFEKEYGINNEVPTVEVPDYEYDEIEVEGQTPELPTITPEEDDYEGHDFEKEYGINNEVPTVDPDSDHNFEGKPGITPENEILEIAPDATTPAPPTESARPSTPKRLPATGQGMLNAPLFGSVLIGFAALLKKFKK